MTRKLVSTMACPKLERVAKIYRGATGSFWVWCYDNGEQLYPEARGTLDDARALALSFIKGAVI